VGYLGGSGSGRLAPVRSCLVAAQLSLPDMRWNRDAGYGEADQLTLTAAEAADGITHEEELSEIFRAKGGAAEGLAWAELALNGDSAA